MKKIKLYCFPYAGGSASIYKKWNRFLDRKIELRPVELAGRGSRIREMPNDSLQQVVDDIFNTYETEFIDCEYALLGHSMGALLAYELALKIKQLEIRQPSHLIFSGRGAPHIKDQKDRKYHLLNERDFRQKVRELGGTPPEFFENPELMDLFLPLLRNDFRIASESFENRKINPFDCKITVFLGKDEEITAEQAYGWKDHTTNLCSLHNFNGGHFFLHEETRQITNLLDSILL